MTLLLFLAETWKLCVYVLWCVGINMCVQVTLEARGFRLPEAVARGTCEPPQALFQKQQAFWKTTSMVHMCKLEKKLLCLVRTNWKSNLYASYVQITASCFAHWLDDASRECRRTGFDLLISKLFVLLFSFLDVFAKQKANVGRTHTFVKKDSESMPQPNYYQSSWVMTAVISVTSTLL